MRLIFSAEQRPTGEVSEAELHALYRHPRTDGGAWLRTNFVTSLDGSIVGADGRSGTINTPSDQHVFALHRAHCETVLVGAGTVRAEGYRAVDLQPWQQEIRAAEGLFELPILAVVSASLDVDPAIAVDDGHHGKVMIITSERADDAAVARFADHGIEVRRFGAEAVDLRAAVTSLAADERGRILCEGGPRLHHDLLAAGLVDGLSLTLAPVVVGGAGSRTTSGPGLDPPAGFRLGFAVHADDETLLTHWVRA